MTKPKIFNLLIKVLSQQHVNVLPSGLKLLPTPLPNKTELTILQLFSRKLRLLEFFYKEKESEEEKSSDDSIINKESH